MKTDPHTLLTLQVLALKLPAPEHEYRFHPKRKWRFDLCWPFVWSVDGERPPFVGVAVEIDGEGHFDKRLGAWIPGRHHRTAGYRNDIEKLNAAVELGWMVFRYVPAHVESGAAARQLSRVLEQRLRVDNGG